MFTLEKILLLKQIPMDVSWYIADLSEMKGKQELYTRQSPQLLRTLRENSIIESAVSSNRIEGVTIDKSRIGTVLFGTPFLRDRDEEEVQGYRNALRLIHENSVSIPISEETICKLHALCRGDVWDAGAYKEKDSDIIQHFEDGSSRIRFKTVSAAETPAAMKKLVDLWHQILADHSYPPLIALAAFNFDFLCIHPFRDGNGRASRLLLLLLWYHLGFEVGRFISLERLIEEQKERYYETLAQSSAGWHEGTHDPWPYIRFILYILKTACKEFEQRVSSTKSPRGAKSDLILASVEKHLGEFTISDIEKACPGVSRDLIRIVLRNLQSQGAIACNGKGPAARWKRRGNTP